MLDKIAITLALALLLPAGCDSEESAKEDESAKSSKTEPKAGAGDIESQKKDARLLLRAYLEMMVQVAKNGTGTPMLPVLDELSGRAKKLSELPAVTMRVERLLAVTKAVIAPIEPGTEAEVSAMLDKFVKDIEGPEAVVARGGGLAALMPAINEEIISLYQALDGTKDRDATIARYLRPLGIDPDRK